MASENIEDITQEVGKLSVSEQATFRFRDETYHSGFTTRLVTMRHERLLTDITLKAGDVSLPCHKLALAAASPYFYRLINCDQVADTLVLPDISPSVLEVIVDFVYTSEVEIHAGLVKELSISCDQLQLSSLKQACDRYIEEKVEPANAIGLYVFACKHNLENTRSTAQKCLLTQAEDVLRLALDVEYKSLNEDALIQWISQDDLDVPNEDTVFKIVEKWVGADILRNKETCLERVLAHVRLCLCTPEFLVRHVKDSPLLVHKNCRKYLEEAMSFMILKDVVRNDRTRPRKSTRRKILLIGGVSDNVANNQCWYQESGDLQWKPLTTLPPEQVGNPWYFNACVVDDGFIITGGRQSSGGITTVRNAWHYSMSKNTWQDLPPMNQARCMHGMVTVGNQVYVMGGWAGKYLDSVERLDTSRTQWTNMAPLPAAGYWCHAVVIQGDIYHLSASDKKTQRYNIAANTWQVLSDMPQWNQLASVLNIGDNIYVVGGNIGAPGMCYNTNTDTYTLLTSHTQAHMVGFALEQESRIVIYGGGSNWGQLNCTSSAEEYEPQSNKWSASTLVLPKPLASHVMIEWK